MTAKELKKLRRSELLEMLLARTEEVERLQAELAEANRKLDDRAILIETSGSIAEASLKLNGVFEAAQAAAEQYLKNIERIALGDEAVREDEKADDQGVEKPEETEKPEPPKKSGKSRKSSKSKQNAKKSASEKKAEEASAETKVEESAGDAE